MRQKLRPIELLAPAKNADIAIEAIKHGADAVYIGAQSHGARRAASNDVSEIARAVEFAHRFQARVYVTVNTLVYDSELASVEQLINNLYKIGVDALIVQDLGLLRLDLPPIALHASTQTDVRTPEKARFMAEMGFSQIVLPREMTLAEMAEIHSTIPNVPLEAFVHGALCVSYSGDCQAGFITSGRSANRGECPQICRHCFDLVDENGTKLITNRHLLSLRDLNRSTLIGEMLDAGVSSFKIEGRLKDAAYVKNTVAAYRRIIDDAIAARSEALVRASIGNSKLTFAPDLNESFNRGYTTFFTTEPRPTAKMASILTPKWIGNAIGKVKTSNRQFIEASLSVTPANGDGLGYFDSEHCFQGFRLNRVEGNRLYPAKTLTLKPGTVIYRNHNRLREEEMAANTARRTIETTLTIRPIPSGFAIDITDRYNHTASTSIEMPHEEAKRPQEVTRRETLCKTGDTDFTVTEIHDLCGNLFIPLSRLAELRRNATSALARAIKATHHYDLRQSENKEYKWTLGTTLSYHDNVSNPNADKFYRSHGVTEIEPALEVTKNLKGEKRVMTCRYCIRRELGHCLKTNSGKEWSSTLYLVSGPDRFRLNFNCRECRMEVYYSPNEI